MQMHLSNDNRLGVALLLAVGTVLAFLATSRLALAETDLRVSSGHTGQQGTILTASYGVTTTVYLPLVLISDKVKIIFIGSDPIISPDEFVQIRNQSELTATMTNWTLCDLENNCYTFPPFTLSAGAHVYVWTKAGSNTVTDLYWGSTVDVWNDVTDTAFLRDQDGRLIDTYTYVVP